MAIDRRIPVHMVTRAMDLARTILKEGEGFLVDSLAAADIAGDPGHDPEVALALSDGADDHYYALRRRLREAGMLADAMSDKGSV